MAANQYYATAGLLFPKDSGQTPASGVNTYYVTAGLPKVVVAAAAGGPFPFYTRRRMRGGMIGMGI